LEFPQFGFETPFLGFEPGHFIPNALENLTALVCRDRYQPSDLRFHRGQAISDVLGFTFCSVGIGIDQFQNLSDDLHAGFVAGSNLGDTRGHRLFQRFCRNSPSIAFLRPRWFFPVHSY
jgi:hypothetical protein